MRFSLRCWGEGDGDVERGGFGVDDRDQAENQESVGLQDENEGGAGVCGLAGRSLTVEGAHQHAKIEAGDMNQIRLWIFFRPRSQARRMPPRSRIWAKERSTRSPRRRMVSRPIADFNRARLA